MQLGSKAKFDTNVTAVIICGPNSAYGPEGTRVEIGEICHTPRTFREKLSAFFKHHTPGLMTIKKRKR